MSDTSGYTVSGAEASGSEKNNTCKCGKCGHVGADADFSKWFLVSDSRIKERLCPACGHIWSMCERERAIGLIASEWGLNVGAEEAEKIIEAAPMLLVLTLMLLGVYTDDFTGETSSKPYAGTGSDADIRVLWKSAQIAAPSISPATLQALREYGKGALPAILQKIISGVH